MHNIINMDKQDVFMPGILTNNIWIINVTAIEAIHRKIVAQLLAQGKVTA